MKKEKLVVLLYMLMGICFVTAVWWFVPAPHPTQCPGSVWATKDSSVVIYIPEEGSPNNQMPRGTITLDGENHTVVFRMSPLTDAVMIYTEENYAYIQDDRPAKALEYWITLSIRANKFVLHIEETTYFTQDQELVLYRVS